MTSKRELKGMRKRRQKEIDKMYGSEPKKTPKCSSPSKRKPKSK